MTSTRFQRRRRAPNSARNFLLRGKVASLSEKSAALEERISRLEKELGPAAIEDRQMALWGLGVLLIVLVSSGFVFKFVYKRDAEFLDEFASYGFAALAAIIVGMGLFFRQERRWFWISAAFVLAGVLAFVGSKNAGEDSTFLALIFYGLVCSLLLIGSAFLLRGNRTVSGLTKKYLLGRTVLGFAALGASVALMVYFLTSAHPIPPTPLKCVVTDEAVAGQLTAVCDRPDSKG